MRRYTRKLVEFCASIKNAKSEIQERDLRLRSNLGQLRQQVDLLDQIKLLLDADAQRTQSEVLFILDSKLQIAVTRLRSYVQRWPADDRAGGMANVAALFVRKRKRSKFAFMKEDLDRMIDDIESWQKLLFNPMWFTIMRSQHAQVGEALTVASRGAGLKDERTRITDALHLRDPLCNPESVDVFLSAGQLRSAQVVDIPFGSMKLVKVEKDTKWRLLEVMHGGTKGAVRDLALKMRHSDPSVFGMLNCVGAVHVVKSNTLGLVYRLPRNMSNPRTLRERLTASTRGHSLSERFRIATQLARAVCSIHNLDMVHKSIRPENILLLDDGRSELGSAFLLGFESVRLHDASTNYAGDADWAKNLYRHPQRQGLLIQDRYVMQHDMYSLGVCLLEIGLWASFIDYGDASSDPRRSQLLAVSILKDEVGGTGTSVKDCLLKYAQRKLPGAMGSKYTDIVVTCLTCLDEESEDFGEDFGEDADIVDKDGMLVAVRYIEKVCYEHRGGVVMRLTAVRF